ncbi:uncharacterized protein LOC144164422 isoform X2 [Haemaphysalis longicornis]
MRTSMSGGRLGYDWFEERDGAEAWEPKPHSRICSRHFIGNRKSEESCSPSYNPSIFPCVVGKRPTRKLRVTTRGRQGGSAQALRTRASPSRSGRRSAPTRGVRRRCGGSGLRRRGTQFRIRAINRGVQCKLKFSHDVGCQTTFAGVHFQHYVALFFQRASASQVMQGGPTAGSSRGNTRTNGSHRGDFTVVPSICTRPRRVWSLPCLVASHRQASRQAPGCLGQSRTRPLTKCSDLHPDASRPPQQRTLVLNCTLKTR